MTVGNIDSTEKGSGARYNDGKPDYSLFVLKDFHETLELHYDTDSTNDKMNASTTIRLLGEFQQTHDYKYLYDILDILESDDIAGATYVLTYGAKKYATHNWIKGMAWSVPLACAVRHSLAILNGEEYDSESGQRHLAHVVCNVFMLIHYAKHYKEGNDLPPKEYFN
jgi:hypothetical protein